MSLLSGQQDEAEQPPPWAAGTEGRDNELSPPLSEQDIETITSYGDVQRFAAGETLWRIGERGAGLFLVLEGQMDILRSADHGEQLVASHGPGNYGGETVTMTGGGAYVGGRARTDLTAVVVPPAEVRRLIATEAELGEKILLSFILRRMRLIAANLGNVTLVGHVHDGETARLQSFLTRNGVPYTVADPTTSPREATRWLAEHDASGQPLPILIHDQEVMVRPSNRDVAEVLGFTPELGEETEYDVAVIGAGPAGLAAA